MTSIMRNIKVFIAVALLSLSFSFAYPAIVSAAEGDTGSCQLESTSLLGLPTWYKYLDGEQDISRQAGDGYVCSPVISDVDAILPIGLAVLDGLLRFAGVVTVVMIFWASFKFLTSQGNGEAAAEARRTAINALIGLVIVIIATSFVSFVGNRLVSQNVANEQPTGNQTQQNNGSGPR